MRKRDLSSYRRRPYTGNWDAGAVHLFLAEYESLREESARALDAQHRIVEWAVGAFAIVFVGVLAASGSRSTDGSNILRLLIFGSVLPLLLVASAYGWLWELYRMERAGAYLRCREVAGRDKALLTAIEWRGRVHNPAKYPLLWENSIHSEEKEQHNFASGFVIFGVGLLICLVVFTVELWRLHPYAWHFPIWQTLAAMPGFAYALILPARFHSFQHELHSEYEPHAVKHPSVGWRRWFGR